MSFLFIDSLKEDITEVNDLGLVKAIVKVMTNDMYKYLIRFDRYFGTNYSLCIMMCLFREKYIVSPEWTIDPLKIFKYKNEADEYYEKIKDKIVQQTLTDIFFRTNVKIQDNISKRKKGL